MTAQPTTCPHGHPYTPANTYVEPKTRVRKCRTCLRTRAKGRYERDYKSPRRDRG